MNNNLSKILLIILAINLALTCVLAVAFVTSLNKLEQQQSVISRKIDDIEPCEDSDNEDSLAVMGGIFMLEMEGKVDEITADLKTDIAGIEESVTKYDSEIESITVSLEELNEKMGSLSNVILSLQEILDSIKNFLNIE